MIRYDIVNGLRNESIITEMLLKRNNFFLAIHHNIGSRARYNIIKERRHIFSTNDRYAIRMWMDLNGLKTGINAYIFTNKIIKNNKNFCLIELKNR